MVASSVSVGDGVAVVVGRVVGVDVTEIEDVVVAIGFGVRSKSSTLADALTLTTWPSESIYSTVGVSLPVLLRLSNIKASTTT